MRARLDYFHYTGRRPRHTLWTFGKEALQLYFTLGNRRVVWKGTLLVPFFPRTDRRSLAEAAARRTTAPTL